VLSLGGDSRKVQRLLGAVWQRCKTYIQSWFI
jgi:hypothetical protein